MTGFLTLTKWCPVCGDAMTRVASDGSATMHRCRSCKTETAKPIAHKRKRSREAHIRRCGRVLRASSSERFFRPSDAG